MPHFPTHENQVYALCHRMINGLKIYPAEFPHVPWTQLNLKRLLYRTKRNALAVKVGAERLATDRKDRSLMRLAAAMKAALKKAQVDAAANPARLTEIGWGPKAEPQAVAVPGVPGDLTALPQGTAAVTLSWQRPSDGGAVVDYRIQRRMAGADWHLVTLVYAAQAVLTRQPTGQTMEYRVLASNRAGLSAPCNTVSVVL